MDKRLTIGILGLQGSVVEHGRMIERCGAEITIIRRPEDLKGIHGLILPGGESTTLGKLLHKQGLFHPLKTMIENGLPVYGTCAGMILLANSLEGGEEAHFGVMDIHVKRNAYGSQLDSFRTTHDFEDLVTKKIPLTFIRAPYILRAGEGVTTWKFDGNIVVAREKNMLVTSFHPELDEDLSIHRYFLNMIS